jgi:Flp pilus assembly protein TadD
MRHSSIVIIASAAIAALNAAPASASDRTVGRDVLYADQAIAAGRYAEAEQKLRASSNADAKDPARLINLATVYAQTQRLDMARAVLDRVRDLPDESLVLADGASYPSHQLAAALLDRLP